MTITINTDDVRTRLNARRNTVAGMREGRSAERAEEILAQIARAEERLDAGLYGTCESCGEEIPIERLNTFPDATKCIACVAGIKPPKSSLLDRAREASQQASSEAAVPTAGDLGEIDEEVNDVSAPTGAGTEEPIESSAQQSETDALDASNTSSRSTDHPSLPEDIPIPGTNGDSGGITVPASLVDSEPDRDMGDLKELADSIAQIGLLQRIAVVKVEEGTPSHPQVRFKVVAGRRRFAAMQLLGWEQVPVEVWRFTEQEASEAALIENLHRKDISVVEEARGYQRLISEFKLTQRDVATRVARSQSHVAKRIALLELPTDALEAVNTNDVTLEEAQHLLKLKDHPKRMTGAWSDFLENRGKAWSRTLSQLVDDELDDLKRDETKKKTEQRLKKEGVKVLKERPGWGDKNAAKLGSKNHYGCLPISPKSHADEPCHAAIVRPQDGKPDFYCTEIKRHRPKGKSDIKAYVVGQEPKQRTLDNLSEEQKAAEEQRRALAQAKKARQEFVRDLIAKKPRSDDAIDLFGAYFDRPKGSWDVFPETGIKDAALYLPLSVTRGLGFPEKDRKAISEFVGASPTNRAAALLGYVAAVVETDLEDMVVADEPDFGPTYRFYFDWLTRNGYELTDAERELLQITDEASTSPNEEASNAEGDDA